MSRTTLKLTKPVDPAAQPAAKTTRARDAQRRKHGATPTAGTPLATPATPRPAGEAKRRPRDAGSGAKRPPREGAFKPDAKRPPREGALRSDAKRPPREGAFKPDAKRPPREGAFKPEAKRPPREASFKPDAKRPPREGAFKPEAKSRAPFTPRNTPRPSPPGAAAAAPVAAPPSPRPPSAAAKGVHENPGDPRLSKLMSERGLCSRREADEWIENGWVKVDGKLVDQLGARVPREARIEVDPAAKRHQQEQVTILLNKPVGYVSGQPEDGHEPAMALIKPENHWAEDPTQVPLKHTHLRGLAPAGRLDIDSTGLLVFTQDGRVARRLIGADSEVEKEYLVRVEGTLTEEGMKLLHHGLELDGVKLKPARVSWANEDQLRFVLREGRKRQIRRMCELVGLTVTGLKRVRSGGVPLGKLPLGQWRYLRRDEKF